MTVVMNLQLAYLRKEWRDQRAIVLGLLLTLPVLMVLAGWALPEKVFVADSPFALVTALGWGAVFVFAASSDLVPGEGRRRTLALLRRAPAGLPAAFLAKLGFYLFFTALFLAYGFLAAGTTSVLAGGAFPALPKLAAGPFSFVWAGFLIVAWVFAASCCLSRGVLAIPATALAFGLLAVPLLVLYKLNPGLGPGMWVLAWPQWTLGIGAVVAAALAFTRGRKWGGGAWRSSRWALAVALVCMLPFYAYAGRDALRWYGHLGADREISSVMIGEGGRYAFVNCYYRLPGDPDSGETRAAPAAPLVVDLRDGSARDAGSRLGHFFLHGVRWRDGRLPQSAVALQDGEERTLLDSRTGLPTRLEASRERGFDRAPWRTPDGRRVRYREGAIEIEGSPERFDVRPWGNGYMREVGHGLEVGSRYHYFDFGRRRLFARKDLDINGYRVAIRSGRWLIWRYGRRDYLLFDPETREREPARGLDDGDRFRALHDDGRAFVESDDGLGLVDPESGSRTPIPMPEGFDVCPSFGDAYAPGRWLSPARTPDGTRVFCLRTHEKAALAVFDDETQRLVVARGSLGGSPMIFLAAALGEERALIVRDHDEIVEVRFGSDFRETRFAFD